MKRVGFYGGTFDPIHFGHLNLCYAVLENHLVDHIFIVPNQQSPLKNHAPKANFSHRFTMCKIAFEIDQRFSVLKIEENSSSYTIDSLNYLQKSYPDFIFHLLIGADQVEKFIHWKEYKKILENFHPIVSTRRNSQYDERMIYQEIPLMEISSTVIRERIQSKLPIDHLVPAKVVDYIYFHHLYF